MAAKVVKIKTLTIGDTIYRFNADEATQYSAGFMSPGDKEKVDDLTPVTEAEFNELFGEWSAPYNPNIYDLTAITSEEISEIFSDL